MDSATLEASSVAAATAGKKKDLSSSSHVDEDLMNIIKLQTERSKKKKAQAGYKQSGEKRAKNLRLSDALTLLKESKRANQLEEKKKQVSRKSPKKVVPLKAATSKAAAPSATGGTNGEKKLDAEDSLGMLYVTARDTGGDHLLFLLFRAGRLCHCERGDLYSPGSGKPWVVSCSHQIVPEHQHKSKFILLQIQRTW